MESLAVSREESVVPVVGLMALYVLDHGGSAADSGQRLPGGMCLLEYS